jgi:uncharacterized membrane protein
MTESVAELRVPSSGRPSTAPSGRLASIDLLRGFVIVLMALDHTRDFFDADALRFNPTDLTQTYPALFLTRFVTHFCAPTFVFLAGASAFLHGLGLCDRAALSRFLWTRGLWLILLDVFVISPVWAVGFGTIELATLWAIGASMIALAGLVWLEPRGALIVGAAILVGHNLLDGVHASQFGDLAPLWRILHEPGPLPFGLHGKIVYPVLPWIGIMALGYGLGPVFLAPPERRRSLLTALGLACLASFVLLRATNLYGDPRPWTHQSDGVMTALSFLNVTKYPPSLLYALVTLGAMFLALPLMERLRGGAERALMTFGRVPLFAYVLHLYVILVAAAAVELAKGFGVEELSKLGKEPPPENFGVGLAGAYVAWVLVVLALYPACRWFAGVKRRRRDWWLAYL